MDAGVEDVQLCDELGHILRPMCADKLYAIAGMFETWPALSMREIFEELSLPPAALLDTAEQLVNSLLLLCFNLRPSQKQTKGDHVIVVAPGHRDAAEVLASMLSSAMTGYRHIPTVEDEASEEDDENDEGSDGQCPESDCSDVDAPVTRQRGRPRVEDRWGQNS